MVARLARLTVPRFKTLSDFMLAKKYFLRALYMTGPERSDPEQRLRRHAARVNIQPENSFLQIRFKPTHKVDIRGLQAHVSPG